MIAGRLSFTFHPYSAQASEKSLLREFDSIWCVQINFDAKLKQNSHGHILAKLRAFCTKLNAKPITITPTPAKEWSMSYKYIKLQDTSGFGQIVLSQMRINVILNECTFTFRIVVAHFMGFIFYTKRGLSLSLWSCKHFVNHKNLDGHFQRQGRKGKTTAMMIYTGCNALRI